MHEDIQIQSLHNIFSKVSLYNDYVGGDAELHCPGGAVWLRRHAGAHRPVPLGVQAAEVIPAAGRRLRGRETPALVREGAEVAVDVREDVGKMLSGDQFKQRVRHENIT